MNGLAPTQESYAYEWQWRNQTSLPPPVKTMGSNTGGWSGAKSFYLSSTTWAGTDAASVFRQMRPGDTVSINHKTDASLWAKCTLAVTPVEYTGFFTFPSSAGEGQGAPVDNTIYNVVLTTGAKPALDPAIIQLANIAAICLDPSQKGPNCDQAVLLAIDLYEDMKAALEKRGGSL